MSTPKHPILGLIVVTVALIAAWIVETAREYQLRRKLGKDYEGPLS